MQQKMKHLCSNCTMNHSSIIINKIWTVLLELLTVIFMLLSMNSVLPLKWQFPTWMLSSHLIAKTQKTAEGIRTDYVNLFGIITVALDKNYSTVIKTLDKDGNSILEQYFDSHGRPAVLVSGFSAVQKEYDSEGRWINTTYLDKTLNPVVTNRGYASIRRTYNENGKVQTEMYYDTDGSPTLDAYKKYGIRYEYDEYDRESIATNLDTSGNAMNNKDHYAIRKKIVSA